MRLTRRYSAVLLAGLGLSGAWSVGSAQGRPLARKTLRPDLIGCWAFYDNRGDRADRSLYWAPAFARLDTSVVRLDRGAAPAVLRAAYKLDSLRRAAEVVGRMERLGLSFWTADSLADTVRVSFSSGFSGTEFVLAVPRGHRADTIRGRAVEFWDFGPPFITPAGAAYAVRVPCAG